MSSVLEDGEVELTDACGVSDCFRSRIFSVCDGEAKNHEEASAWSYDDPDFAVYKCGLGCASTASGGTVGYSCCAADL